MTLNSRRGDYKERDAPEERARAILEDNKNSVGILIERADGYFSFLHRTFQEYLASIWLLDDPEHAVERIGAKMDDPRWREPVLLAFGHATLRGDSKREFRDQLIRQMIDTDEPGLAVRRARFIAVATTDMATLPSI
jgi:predicted NACHT family NTPase